MLCGRRDIFSNPGGDTVELLCLKQTAEEIGHQVELHAGPYPNLLRTDILHCFNLTRPLETLSQIREARRMRIPVILHPILAELARYRKEGRVGFPSEFLARLPDEFQERLRALWLGLFRGAGLQVALEMFFWGPLNILDEAVSSARLALVPSDAEGARLREIAPIPTRKIPPLLNCEALEKIPFGGNGDPGQEYALCIGRIEDLKNQIQMAKAANLAGIPLIFAGRVNPRHRFYARKLRLLAAQEENLSLIENPDRGQVLSLLSHCRIHVQASWCETIGLASLEAACHGAALVCSRHSDAEEIFSEGVFLADPGDVSSIQRAMEQAWELGKNDKIRNWAHILTDSGRRREILCEIWTSLGKWS